MDQDMDQDMGEPNAPGVRVEQISFAGDGFDLVGVLRVPAAAARAAVVLTGPFTGVKEQVAGVYADRLRARGSPPWPSTIAASARAAAGAATRTARASSPTCGRRSACCVPRPRSTRTGSAWWASASAAGTR